MLIAFDCYHTIYFMMKRQTVHIHIYVQHCICVAESMLISQNIHVQ